MSAERIFWVWSFLCCWPQKSCTDQSQRTYSISFASFSISFSFRCPIELHSFTIVCLVLNAFQLAFYYLHLAFVHLSNDNELFLLLLLLHFVFVINANRSRSMSHRHFFCGQILKNCHRTNVIILYTHKHIPFSISMGEFREKSEKKKDWNAYIQSH